MTPVLAEQFGTTEHDGFRGAYLSGNTPKPHSMDRPVDRAAGRAQRDLDLRAHPRGALALGAVDRAAAHAAHRVEALVVELDDVGLSLDSRGAGDQGPSGGRLGRFRAAVRRRARRPAPPSPLQCNFARIWSVPLLPHVSCDGDHGVSVERGDAGARAADCGARVAEDDEALRQDGGHDHRRRDRTHRDLNGGDPPGAGREHITSSLQRRNAD